jgi:acyl-CoA synthetase (NDP forming)
MHDGSQETTGSSVPPRLTLPDILNPRSVAVIGASENVAKFGGRIMHYLTKHRFPGRVLPINPGRKEILGLPAYARVTDVPEDIDVAIMAVPPERLLDAAKECADAGVGCCVIMTTGFAEIGEFGRARQDELVAIARSAGMRIIGPNCMGLISPHHALALTSSLVLEDGELMRGPIGLISQSGALMVSMYDRAHSAGIGFSACVSLGNQSDLEICDVLEYMIEDPKTRAICLYVEGFKTPRRFLDLAVACRKAGKPLFMVKAGRTEAGVRAAMSHTASLAGSYAVLEAACEERGVLLLDDVDDMIRAADALLRFGVPAGGGVCVFSPSGGGASTGVDRVCERGLAAARLGARTVERLDAYLLPTFQQNPIDLGGRRDPNAPTSAGEILAILAEDPDVSALFVVLTTVPFYAAVTREIGKTLLGCGKPFVLTVTPGAAADEPREALRELGCPYYDHMDSALRVLATLTKIRDDARLTLPEPPVRPGEIPVFPDPARLRAGRLTEVEVKRLAARYGIPVAAERLCSTVEEAISAAAEIGYPVAFKAVCRDLVHKSDVGAVRLGLENAAMLGQAWTEVMAAVRRALPDAGIEGGLVQAMSRGELELIMGARRDPQFGPILVAGAGGTLVEFLSDVSIALAPVDARRARALLERLKAWPLMRGLRGKPALDVEAAVEAIVRLGWLAVDLGDRLVELELNPLMMRAAGKGVTAVDGRATVAARD